MKDERRVGLNRAQRDRLRAILEEVPYAHLIGIEMEEIERGSATLRFEVRDELRQNNGIVHGGAIASLIDTAAAFAIITLIEPGQSTTTIDLTIQYLRPLLKGQARAHARVLRSGRRVTVVAVDVTDESEVLAATALTSYLMLG